MINKLLPDDVRGQLFFLLDFYWAGLTIRLSTQELDVTVDGTTVRYNDGLEWGGNIDEVTEFISEDTEIKSAGVTLHIQDMVDVADIISKGHMLGAATGKLYIYSQKSDKRLLLIDGRFLSPTWDENLPLAGTIEEFPLQDDIGLYPNRNHRLTPDTWNGFILSTDLAANEFYPTIIGNPSLLGSESAATPAYYVGQVNTAIPARRYAMIAGHRVEATQVKISNQSDSPVTSHTETIIEVTDDNGVLCSFVPLNNFGTLGTDYEKEDDFRIDWSVSTPSGGYEDLKGAGDVIEWMLGYSTIRWDTGRIAAIKQRANQFLIDTYICPSPDETGVRPMEWLQDNILPILPVSPRIGPNGWYLVWWTYEATKEDAILNIKNGINAERNGIVETTSRDEVFNEVRVNYSNDSTNNGDGLSFTITGDTRLLSSDVNNTVVSSFHSVRSYDMYGQTATQEISAVAVNRSSTASLIANWMIQRGASQRFVVAYDVDIDDGIALELGDVVTVTDTGRGLSDRIGLVSGRNWNADGTVTVEVHVHAISIGPPS